MFGSWKISKKDKSVKKNDIHITGFTIKEKYKRKLNIIKIIKKLIYF